jgi:hypothetical protein
MAWGRISHETNESGSFLLSKQYKYPNLNCNGRMDESNVFLS